MPSSANPEHILDALALVQMHRLRKRNRPVRVFEPDLSDEYNQILDLMRSPEAGSRST